MGERLPIIDPVGELDRRAGDPLDLVDTKDEPRREAGELGLDPKLELVVSLSFGRPQEFDRAAEVLRLCDQSQAEEEARSLGAGVRGDPRLLEQLPCARTVA